MKNSISISTWRWRLFNWLLVPSGSRLWESSWSWWVKMPLFMAYMKKWGYCFSGYVQSGKSGSRSLSPHGTSWGRTTSSPTSLVVWTRYIRPGGGPSFLGVQRHLQGVQTSSYRSLCHKSKCETVLVHISHSRFHGLEGRHLQYSWDDLSIYAFLPFTLLDISCWKCWSLGTSPWAW